MKNMADRFRKFSEALEDIDVEKIYLQSVKETSEVALDLNKAQMLELGIDSQGKPLGEYKESTKRRKRAKGQPTDHITLRDTGKFQDRMFLDTKQVPVLIDSKDQKVPLIEKRWPKALGLYPVFKDQYAEVVLERFRVKVNKVIETKAKILQ